MDDLNGLFSASPVAPPVASPVGGQGLTMPGQQVMSPPVMPITPTQTMAAEQLNNKTQILNQFQVGGGVGGMVSPPGRPAPSLPGLVPAQPPTSPLLPPTSSQSLTLSSSFTEPGPVEFDDNFFGSPAPTVPEEPAAPDSVDGSSDFFIGDNETSPPTVVETTEETKAVEETKTEEPNKEAEQTERKTSFWSGLWSRNKDHGSKENILENEEDGRGGNEQKFIGEGQTFKGKLIGVLEVKEARGDRMCQDALQELKMAIKASGEHKQKVNIQIAVDGLKIRDEKSGDCLYHHPVHKISFIAQDMTDNRAFGYVYGSPENGHRFFGIKTEKAAGQVVVAMRDLFQVVFEMKKKEIDEAKQSMETGSLMNDPNKVNSSAASFPDGVASDPLGGVGAIGVPSAPIGGNKNTNAIDDLLGLETELSAIQAGIQQIDKIAPSPPMSFQTDSMMPLHLSMSPQQQQQQQQPQVAPVGRPIDRKPVAVMNQSPAVSEFSTAPFLPPPPGKPGRRQDDRYAVFDNVQRYNNNNNILQQQQTNPPPPPVVAPAGTGLGAAFGDEGPPSIFSQSLAFSEGAGAPVFSQPAPPQQQPPVQLQPRQQMGISGVNKSGSQDLASLFTDLDPLGTGKSKPFVDKKDFFTDSKTAMKLTGASSDSLNNVGLNMSEFVDANPGHSVPQSHYTNSVLSSSSCLSSRYSTTPPRSLDTQLGTASYCRPPPVARAHSSHGAHRSSTLRVALPPEDTARSASPAISSQSSNNYGSILELEASPRRFRKQEIPDFYTTAPDSLSSYHYGRYGSEFDSIESNIPIPSEPPPALPRRPPKLSSASPPPLPPKKQSGLSCSLRYEAQSETSDIYDFIHENTESGGRCEEVTVEKLARMSVVELSQKMMEGKLPPHLTGMSLFELVEFISKQTKSDASAGAEEETLEMKPSFSDNFVAQNKPPGGLESSNLQQVESQHYLPDPSLSRLTPKSSDSLSTNPSRFPYSLSQQSNTQSDASNVISSSCANQNKSGFEDDFSRFNPEPTATSAFEEKGKETEPYDKYAVFRELQMEEEISNAWRSPSEETPGQQIEESEPEFLDIQNVDIPAEDPEFYEEDEHYDPDETFYDTEFESQNQTFEQSPFQEEVPKESKGDDEIVMESFNLTEDINDEPAGGPVNDDLPSQHKVGNGQAVILEDPGEAGEENSAFQDTPAPAASEKSGWATFEDDKASQFSAFLSAEEQSSLLNRKESEDTRRESFSSDWEPAFYNRSRSTDPDTPRNQNPSWHKSFDPFDKRPGTEPAKQWSNAWNETRAGDETSSGQNSLKNSSDSIFNNPFTDNFVSSGLNRAVSETPPMFEGEGQCDRSIEEPDTTDVFDENNSFANSNFKIQAKTTTKIPNSESVDIFKVSADPFDDDFFK